MHPQRVCGTAFNVADIVQNGGFLERPTAGSAPDDDVRDGFVVIVIVIGRPITG